MPVILKLNASGSICTDSSAVQDLVEEIYQRYGQIDILVNNAGYGIFEAFDRISDQQVQEMFEVNTFALMQFSRLMGAHMKAAGKGHIVDGRQHGRVSSRAAKSSLYSATKFAAIWLLQCSAVGTHAFWCPCDDGPSRPHPDHFL